MTSLSERLASLSPEQRALLAKRLKDSKHNGTKAQIPPQSRETNAFPLSFTQRRLWFSTSLNRTTRSTISVYLSLHWTA
jgi:LEA14-like dessication related protein